jgi:hypothetical protein
LASLSAKRAQPIKDKVSVIRRKTKHCDSTSAVDPDSMGSLDSYPDPRAKIALKNRKKVNKFHVLKCWMFSFEDRRLLL